MNWRESIDLPPVGHSQPIPFASRVGNLLFTSAIMGADPATGDLPADMAAQAANCFQNLRNVLAKVGATTDDIGVMSCYIKEASARAHLNDQWLAMFPDEHNRPARHTIVQENLNYALQIQVIANIQPR